MPKEVLVKIEYHGQVWYITQEATMGTTHAKRNLSRQMDDRSHPQQVDGRQVCQADILRSEAPYQHDL